MQVARGEPSSFLRIAIESEKDTKHGFSRFGTRGVSRLQVKYIAVLTQLLHVKGTLHATVPRNTQQKVQHIPKH